MLHHCGFALKFSPTSDVTENTCISEALTINQPDTVITARLGEPVTLNCTFSNTQYVFWYKQRPGDTLQVMVVAHVRSGSIDFKSGFSALDFSIQKDDGAFHLTIKNVSFLDEASYFCATSELTKLVFGNGTFLSVNDNRDHRLELKTQIHTPQIHHSSDPMILDCTVLSQMSTEELSMFWFRPTSGVSRPVSIYMEKNCSSAAESKPHTQSCVYRLPVEHSSGSGTFYCAVASYGQLLFGDGAISNKKDKEAVAQDPVFLSLTVALALCAAAAFFLAYLKCKETKSAYQISLGTQLRSQGDEEMASYAALQFTEGRSRGGRKKRGPPQESVYPVRRLTGWASGALPAEPLPQVFGQIGPQVAAVSPPDAPMRGTLTPSRRAHPYSDSRKAVHRPTVLGAGSESSEEIALDKRSANVQLQAEFASVPEGQNRLGVPGFWPARSRVHNRGGSMPILAKIINGDQQLQELHDATIEVVQLNRVQEAEPGGTATLPCFDPASKSDNLSWYKQTLGLKPEPVNITVSDEATYYCTLTVMNELHFENGTFLTLKAASSKPSDSGQSVQRQTSTQDADELVNYAALNFSEKRAKRERKKRELPHEDTYARVRC
ncbi:uncharacterized protein LOC134439341 [Engraulis encrasicolus]|uniref:uncharacterized protein LOC134439341 n=1 Tax=Engraulis encrasicolus TaxID=184585 RepID=UPI002FD6B0A8